MTKQHKKFRSDFGVYICDHIFKQNSPVLLVVHDEEQSWQFLCGGDLENDNCHFVGVGHILEKDTSLEEMAELPTGYFSERSSISSQWVTGKLDA